MPAISHRRRTALLLAGLLPALASLAPAPARANDRDPRATPVPVAACVQAGSSNLNVSPWASDGQFSVYGTGVSVKLHCPLLLNNVDLGGTTDDNDISKFRVHYRDTDGFGTLASVAVKLQRFAVGAGGVAESTVVCSWTSDIDGTGATTAAKATKTCAHDLAAEAFYHFEVRLQTGSGSHSAQFIGISFPL